MTTTETEQKHLMVVTEEGEEKIVSPEDLREPPAEATPEGAKCPVEGCDAILKNRKTLSMHMRNQHGLTLSGKPAGTAKPKQQKTVTSKKSPQEELNENIGKLVFPEGLPIFGDLEKMESMMTRFLNICEDAWKLREGVKEL